MHINPDSRWIRDTHRAGKQLWNRVTIEEGDSRNRVVKTDLPMHWVQSQGRGHKKRVWGGEKPAGQEHRSGKARNRQAGLAQSEDVLTACSGTCSYWLCLAGCGASLPASWQAGSWHQSMMTAPTHTSNRGHSVGQIHCQPCILFFVIKLVCLSVH
jgi:hypothetical protein